MRTDSPETDSTYDWRRDGWLAACALTAVLLIVSAATPHAAGFDTFLRAFVFCLALVRAFAGFRRGGAWLPLSAALIAILFNPLRPIGMSAAGWVWCDLIAAAWFAIVGAWRLLRSWDPQRGWAAAAVSVGALAVPAVAAFSAPNRDALDPSTANENLAVMNAATAAPDATATLDATNANADASDMKAMPPTQASAAHSSANRRASEATNREKPADQEISASAVTRAPPLANADVASPANRPADIEPLNNGSAGNQD